MLPLKKGGGMWGCGFGQCLFKRGKKKDRRKATLFQFLNEEVPEALQEVHVSFPLTSMRSRKNYRPQR